MNADTLEKIHELRARYDRVIDTMASTEEATLGEIAILHDEIKDSLEGLNFYAIRLKMRIKIREVT